MIKFSFVGDISLGEHYFSFGHGPRSIIEKRQNPFALVSNIFYNSDLVIGNLEGPISDIGFEPNSPHSRVFRGSPLSAKVLKDAGFNVLSIANNHSIQHGKDAFLDTVKSLQDLGITVIGLTSKPVTYLKIKERTIALIGYSKIKDNTDEYQDSYFSPDHCTLINTIKEAKSQSDLVILSIHWGHEDRLMPEDAQILEAKTYTNAGVDIIAGHHTHTLQPIAVSKSNVVAFSLGNFVFDLGWRASNRESTILQVQLSPTEITSVEHIPISINMQGIPNHSSDVIKLGDGLHTLSKLGDIHASKHTETILKLIYFFRNILKGRTLIKLKFLLWKFYAR
jgi:poly-gamma-glutamate synthesis protein (capsule biosynthesis protein)